MYFAFYKLKIALKSENYRALLCFNKKFIFQLSDIIIVNFYRIILSEHVENRTENRRKHFLIFDRISMKVFYTVMCKTGSPRNRQLFIMLWHGMMYVNNCWYIKLFLCYTHFTHYLLLLLLLKYIFIFVNTNIKILVYIN